MEGKAESSVTILQGSTQHILQGYYQYNTVKKNLVSTNWEEHNLAAEGIVKEAVRTGTIFTHCCLRGKIGESSRGKNKS